MPNININIGNKRAIAEGAPVIVCGNSDYNLQFTFDAEWSEATYKTARFVYIQNGQVVHEDVDFQGTTAKVPVLTNTEQVKVGVYAGELYTSTPAVIPCKLSILCGSGDPATPTPEEDARIMQLLNLAIAQQADAEEAAVKAVEANEAAQDAATKVEAIVAGNEAYTKRESDTKYAPAIIGEASGAFISVQDSAGAPLPEFAAFGESTQDGEPAPDAQVDIVSIDKNLVVKSCGKNLAESFTNATYTTQWQPCFFVMAELKPSAEYTISFDTTVANDIYVNENLSKTSAGIITKNGRNIVTFTTLDNLEKNSTNYNASNGWIVFKNYIAQSQALDASNVQLELGVEATPYEPYKSTEAALTLADDFRGIPVAEGGNYVDEDGQQWICDSVEKYADGTGKHIQRVGSYTFDGTETWAKTSTWNNKSCFGGINILNDIVRVSEYRTLANIKSTHFVTKAPGTLSANNIDGIGQGGENGIYISVYSLGITTVEDFKTWLSSNKVTMFYPLAEPIETDLTAEQVVELEKLQTFATTTHIYASNGAGMALKYGVDTKTYINNKIAEMYAAVLNN